MSILGPGRTCYVKADAAGKSWIQADVELRKDRSCKEADLSKANVLSIGKKEESRCRGDSRIAAKEH